MNDTDYKFNNSTEYYKYILVSSKITLVILDIIKNLII